MKLDNFQSGDFNAILTYVHQNVGTEHVICSNDNRMEPGMQQKRPWNRAKKL